MTSFQTPLLLRETLGISAKSLETLVTGHHLSLKWPEGKSQRIWFKIAARLREWCLSLYLHRQLQRNYFFLKSLRKEENLNSDIILFEDDSGLTNKISLFDLTACSQSGRGRWEYLFWAFIVWKKKSELIIFFPNDCLR